MPATAKKAAAAVCFAAVLGAGCQPSPPPAPPLETAAGRSPATMPSPSGNGDALAWWKRTIAAPRTVPVRASVVVTRFHAGKPPTISRYEVLEALGGRKYRITYHAPASAAGRIVLCDGQTIWQYEPNHDTVLRRPVADASGALTSASEAADSAAPPAGEDGDSREKEEDFLPALGMVDLEPDADSVAGRATRVLALHDTPGGPVVERRWVDTRTGRTLRTESSDAQGKKQRRVEMTQVEFSPPIEPGEFLPRLAPGVRIVDTTQKNPLPHSRRETEATARLVHLPLRARNFILRSASATQTLQPSLTSPQTTAKTAPASEETTHLIYTSGTATISVFVTRAANSGGGGNDGGITLTGAAGWKPALLKKGNENLRAWTQETPSRTAIAWTQSHDRVVAVAQLPVRDFLPVAEALASGK